MSRSNVRREVTTERINGKIVTKTVITESIVNPDGSKTVKTREEVNEGPAEMGGYRDVSGRMPRFSSEQSRAMDPRDEYANRYAANSPYNQGDSRSFARNTRSAGKMSDFIEEVVNVHNIYRRKHKVESLKNNPELSVLAQRWADELAERGILSHSNHEYRGQKLGENVASKWASGNVDYTGQEVTDQWYSEKKKFDFNRNDFISGTGHFTQVVWKGSEQIGVGKAFSRDGRVYVVCNYYPAGNMMGQFGENVFPES